MTCTYVVGRYRPAGNFAAQYQKNVPKGSFDQSICKQLDDIVRKIEDGSKKSNQDFVTIDDKFGEEKAATFNKKQPFANSSNNGKMSSYGSKGGHDISHVSQGGGQETKASTAWNVKMIAKMKKNEKSLKADDNVIRLDEKIDSVEEAEKLIGKNRNRKESSKKKVGGNRIHNSKGQSAKIDRVKNQSSKSGHFKPVVLQDMEITTGVPLSRNSSNEKKTKANKGQKFLIKTDDNSLLSQRQIDSIPNDFAQKGLTAHNTFRQIHGISPMILDPKMSAEAEEYAKMIAKEGNLVHSKTGGKYGENLAMGCTGRDEAMSAEEATKNWYVMSSIPYKQFGVFFCQRSTES